jgi:uncharacterized membrane protein YphA (DoxX/SURF4 family)
MKNYVEYSRIFTRIAISIVFLWFGINQIINPNNFMGYLPSFILLSTYAKTFIYLNGIFELILGAFLILGLFTRITALILGINLIGIILGLGYNDIAVRDFGLMLITLAIFLGGKDKWCLENKIKRL